MEFGSILDHFLCFNQNTRTAWNLIQVLTISCVWIQTQKENEICLVLALFDGHCVYTRMKFIVSFNGIIAV